MDIKEVTDLSTQLKELAQSLSFLGHPRYPLNDLYLLFPQHKDFIDQLEDVSVPFPVDVDEKRRAIETFYKNLERSNVPKDIKLIFTKRVQDYEILLLMLDNFGTVFFYEHAKKLYGSSHKLMRNNSFLYFLEEMPKFCFPDESDVILNGEEAQNFLRKRMLETFDENEFEVKASTSLLSDSSAGRKVLKLNPTKDFTTGHLEIFLVHEGWVHLGTSLNGAKQVNHPWLSTWAPRTTFLQEGLAILTELITGCMTLERWNKIILRHLATSMGERGSNITDVYAYLRHHNMEDLDAFKLALRVFRGVPLEGGMAFTKELLYLRGVIELLYYMHFYQISLKELWVGKMSFEELVILKNSTELPKPDLAFFPEALENPEVEERLRKLKELSFSLFKQGGFD